MNKPSLEQETTLRMAEHELLLSFCNDEDTEWFVLWFNEVGWNQFEKWLKKNRNDV